MGARCVVALGANLGDRAATLRAAVAELAATPGITVTACSPVVSTRAVGGPQGSPDYLNAVVELAVDLDPEELLCACQDVERRHGRERVVRWGPRTLDVDVVCFEGVRRTDPHLTLPHPRAHERAFVLVPWSLMDPDAALGGRPVRELAQHAPDLPGLTVSDIRLDAGADHRAPGPPQPQERDARG